jgi:alcohol dehydrogenase class IV
MKQIALDSIKDLDEIFSSRGTKKIFIIHGKSYFDLPITNDIKELPAKLNFFCNTSPNPSYEDVCIALDSYKKSGCEAILAIGGGSVIDIAKCVKLFASLQEEDFLNQKKYTDNKIPIIAIPTTAGSGSEATHFAVIYKSGIKLSLVHESLIPSYVILIPDLLKTLPLYQKKCTFLDALCQAIESWWSIKSTEKSIYYSRKAIKCITESYKEYLKGNDSANGKMLSGANYSGKAINITQTTTAHALSYKITSDFNLPHGHAVAFCLTAVWRSMLDNMDRTIDTRGKQYINNMFIEISLALGYDSPDKAILGFSNLLNEMDMIKKLDITEDKMNDLIASADAQRLKNSPVSFNSDMIYNVYYSIKHN